VPKLSWPRHKEEPFGAFRALLSSPSSSQIAGNRFDNPWANWRPEPQASAGGEARQNANHKRPAARLCPSSSRTPCPPASAARRFRPPSSRRRRAPGKIAHRACVERFSTKRRPASDYWKFRVLPSVRTSPGSTRIRVRRLVRAATLSYRRWNFWNERPPLDLPNRPDRQGCLVPLKVPRSGAGYPRERAGPVLGPFECASTVPK